VIPGMAAPAPAPVVDPGKYRTQLNAQYVRFLVRCDLVLFAPLLNPDSQVSPLLHHALCLSLYPSLSNPLSLTRRLSFSVKAAAKKEAEKKKKADKKAKEEEEAAAAAAAGKLSLITSSFHSSLHISILPILIPLYQYITSIFFSQLSLHGFLYFISHYSSTVSHTLPSLPLSSASFLLSSSGSSSNRSIWSCRPISPVSRGAREAR
jgi:hypothetical protein